MTVTIGHLLGVAEHEVGYVEHGGADGHSGNVTKYWAELAPHLQGAPWCAAFQRWVDRHAGSVDLPISNPYYCPSIVTYARQHRLWLPADKGSPGDMVLFSWKKNGVADHVGRIRARSGSSYLTVEGNTAATNAGGVEAQRNGGGVYNKTRPINGTILGVLDYSRFLALTAATGLPPRRKVKANPYAAHAAACTQGAKGDQVRFVQWAVGVPVDGVFGKQTTYAVHEFQKYHHLVVDGIVGPKTITALRAVTH
jgi:peptidoglycan hydrolase-like protein with peptidoglycan-binding domain